MSRGQRDRTARGRGQWRSLEQLADDPQALAFAEREFPEGITEPPTQVTRRTMLSLIGASLSMAGLAGCRRPVEKIVPFVEAPESLIPGVPRYYATTMPLGLGGVGLIVENHEGRPTKIEGNAKHPASGGATHAGIQASILNLYDPDRSQKVLHDGTPSDWAAFVSAWTERAADHAADGGARLAVLAESFSSPTLARLQREFAARYPSASWVTHEAVSDENIFGGIAAACGSPLRPLHHLERARTILSLDSDFLLTETESIRNAAGFAEGRRVRTPSDEMNRLYVVEAAHSLTGSNADHRLRLSADRVAPFTAALAAALDRQGLRVELPQSFRTAGGNELDTAWVEAVAADLLAHRGAGLILAGRRQPAAVHAAVYALNAALGNAGVTVSYEEMPDATPLPDRGALSGLVQAMNAGTIDTLVVIGGNPVFDAAADLDFAAALAAVPHVVHLGHGVDETGAASKWHLPRAHYLESWGDVGAAGGTRSVVQPLIRPLFGGKSETELLGLLATGEDRPGYDHVRDTWSGLLGDADFEPRWHGLLHDGLWGGEAAAAPAPAPLPTAFDPLGRHLASSPQANGLELVFQPSPAVFDGRWANNGWLQELPDSMTKLTWDNAALISPATAEEQGLRNEQMVRLTYRGRELSMPVWIVPGQADGTVVVHLGYGRRRAGRVGDGVGFDVYTLRTAEDPDSGRGLTLTAAGETYRLSQTQDHGSMTEPELHPMLKRRQRPMVRYATRDEYREHPGFAAEMVEVPHEKSMWEEKKYNEGHQWGMSIDLNACTGCNACVIACQSENNIPVVGKEQVRNGREMQWLRVDRYFEGDTGDPETFFQPVPCMQCENAPCEQVCPVAATVHDDEGLNLMVYNRCIGTRYCSNNCPYKVRRFNYFNYTKDTPEIMQMAANPDVTVRSRGVMEKCTYCTQRINAAKIDAKLAGRALEDGDVRTACQQACPSRAIEFGDLLDPDSRVNRAKAGPRNYTLLEEVYTRPRTSFLAKLKNPNPALTPPAAEEEDSHG